MSASSDEAAATADDGIHRHGAVQNPLEHVFVVFAGAKENKISQLLRILTILFFMEFLP